VAGSTDDPFLKPFEAEASWTWPALAEDVALRERMTSTSSTAPRSACDP
jgi:hypothetical protein